MGWWWSSSSSQAPRAADAADDARLQEAQSAIASIFAPTNRSLTPAPTQPAAIAEEKGTLAREKAVGSPSANASIESTASEWQHFTRRVRGWLPQSSSTYQPKNTEETSTPSTSSAAASEPPTWDQLPPSPLAGYTLTERGLVDELRTPPHTLAAGELKALIHELTVVEQNAKYDADAHFSEHLGSRTLHGLELLINPCLLLVGLYLMTYKTVQLYSGALPQDSIVFTRLLSLVRWRMPAGQRELLAQRHRRLMRATNARVALTFATGVGVAAIACVSRPSRNVMDDAPDMQTAKELAAFQQHAAASVKWCWYVYYHHPAYRALTNP